MSFRVWCNIGECVFEELECSDVAEVYDFEKWHENRYGEAHILKFERITEQPPGRR